MTQLNNTLQFVGTSGEILIVRHCRDELYLFRIASVGGVYISTDKREELLDVLRGVKRKRKVKIVDSDGDIIVFKRRTDGSIKIKVKIKIELHDCSSYVHTSEGIVVISEDQANTLHRTIAAGMSVPPTFSSREVEVLSAAVAGWLSRVGILRDMQGNKDYAAFVCGGKSELNNLLDKLELGFMREPIND